MARYCVQVVAHEDDDLFFINPDVHAAISAGRPTVTVFVTAGQISGNGDTPGARAYSRQLGIMAAYAEMAAAADPQWAGEALWVAGRQVDRYRLADAAGPVEVVFCGLPDGGLAAIYAGGTGTTVPAAGGPVTRTFTYSSADVLNLLAGLLAYYQPAVLRTQDPTPDARYSAEHADHLAVARWAAKAAPAYSDSLILIHHRCYNIHDVPVDLAPVDAVAKAATVGRYLPFDGAAVDSAWTDRMYHRWPRGAGWMAPNRDGRLQVFVVRSGLLWTWWETAAGWSAPIVLAGAGGPVAPAVAVAANADGRLQVFGRRLSDHHIVSTYQTAVNGTWVTAWADHGSPNPGANADQVGAPACVRIGDGRLQVFVRNGGGGVSALMQSTPNGTWPTVWADLGGTGVQGDPAAATNPTGRVELVAATLTGVWHWWQQTVGGPFIANNVFPAPPPGSPPVAVLAADGAVAVVYRAAGTGEVTVTTQTGPAAGWDAPVTVPGRPGPVTPAAVAPAGTGRRPMLIVRSAAGTYAVAVPQQIAGWSWTDLPGGPFIDTPAAVVDAAGAVVLAAIGFDGAVQTCRQTAAGAGRPFGPWQTLPG